jgi:ubiquinone/menaquinone biosynthesis C-methylase UbiE
MFSTLDQYIQKLIVSDPLMQPLYKKAIQALELPPGSRGLDVGCGIGFQCLLLAEAVSPGGHVTGLDIEPEFLTYGSEMVRKSGFMNRVTFEKGDMNALPFGDDTFDWLWSANCVGYPARDPLPMLKELSRVIKPGGKIAVLIYASQMLLPGYPMLEARLNATSAGIAPFTADMKPETHYMRILGWFHKAGLGNAVVRTFWLDIHAPLSVEMRDALAALIDMRWGTARSDMAPEDWSHFLRLTQPDSPEYILNLPDYYAFVAVSLFQGTVIE